MKRLNYLKYLALIMIFGLISCETEDVNSIKGMDDFSVNDESGAFLRLMMDDPCVTVESFDLLERDFKTPYGVLTIYFDGMHLVMKYDLSAEAVAEGWLITESRLWYGAECIGGNVVPDFSDPRFDRVFHDPGTPSITREETLSSRMECICIQTKIIIEKDGVAHIVIPFRTAELLLWSDQICAEECEGPGTGTPGYWKNHPEAWPVDDITVGGVTYTKEEAIEIMKMKKVDGDKTHDMFNHLVSAMLNVAIGNISGCIDDTIDDANDWMAANGPVGSGVSAESEAWQDGGEDLKDMLDDYNNGHLCAEHRD